jgi:hypothetical protein
MLVYICPALPSILRPSLIRTRPRCQDSHTTARRGSVEALGLRNHMFTKRHVLKSEILCYILELSDQIVPPAAEFRQPYTDLTLYITHSPAMQEKWVREA